MKNRCETWSTAPLKLEMPGPGKVTNIPAVALSPSTCVKRFFDLRNCWTKLIYRKGSLKRTMNWELPDSPQWVLCTYRLHPVIVNICDLSLFCIELLPRKFHFPLENESESWWYLNTGVHLVGEKDKSSSEEGTKVLSEHVVAKLDKTGCHTFFKSRSWIQLARGW